VAKVTSAIATMVSVMYRQPGEDTKERGYDDPSTTRNGADHGSPARNAARAVTLF
jgi:hypothetical protein